MCKVLHKLIKPNYATDWKNLLDYETIFTSDTHNMIENHPINGLYLHEGEFKPVVSENVRY